MVKVGPWLQLFTLIPSGTPPTLISLNYDLADPVGGGQPIIITGTDMDSATSVLVGVTSATILENTSTSITFTMPAKSAGSYNVTVITVGGTSNGLPIEVWAPSQITGVDAVFDSRKETTLSGNDVTDWGDTTVNSADIDNTFSSDNPIYVPNTFGNDVPSIRFTPQQSLSLAAGRHLSSGRSVFAVGKWVSTDATSSIPTVFTPLTVVDFAETGAGGGFGASADQLDYCNHDPGGSNFTEHKKGSGFNDGVTRLFGFTHNASTDDIKAFVGTTQQGTTDNSNLNVAADYWSGIGAAATLSTPSDGWDGDLASVIIVNADLTGSDFTNLYKWAQQSYGLFDVSTLSLSGWWRGSFSASPWSGVTSAGASGGRDLSEGTNPPSAGTAVNGFTPADFDGTNDIISSAVQMTSFVGSSGGIAILFKADSASAPQSEAYADTCLMSDAGGAPICFAINTSGLRATVYDGVSWKKTTAITCSFGEWHWGFMWWDGSNLYCQLDNGTIQSIALAGTVTPDGSVMRLGTNYSAASFYDGQILDVKMKNGVWTEAERTLIIKESNARYGVPFLSPYPSPASLRGWFDGSSYVAGKWYNRSTYQDNPTQTTLANQPSLVSSDLNGHNTVSFDGTNDLLLGSAISTYITASAYYSYAVINVTSVTADSGATYGNDAVWGDAGQFAGLFIRQTGTTLKAYNWDGSDDHADTTISTGTWYIVSTKHVSGNISIRLNNGSWTDSASGDTSSLAASLNIGNVLSPFHGKIAELLIYNADIGTTADAFNIAYLQAKYNL